MGRWLTCPNRLSSNRDMYVPDTPANFPSPQWEKMLTCLPRLTLAQLRTLRSTAVDGTCHRDLTTSHRPDGEMADLLAPIHTCTTANAPVNYCTGGACRRDLQNFPSTHGRLTFCSLFAGRRCCCCLWRHSVNRELPDLLQHSCHCARSCSNVPIAPIGKLLT
jgi:hypothetical protein